MHLWVLSGGLAVVARVSVSEGGEIAELKLGKFVNVKVAATEFPQGATLVAQGDRCLAHVFACVADLRLDDVVVMPVGVLFE